MIRVVFYLFVLLFSYSNVCSQSPDLEEAQSFYNAQEYHKAFEIFKQCAIEDTSNLACVEKAGMSAYRLGDIPNAKKYFIALEQLDSINQTALNQLSVIYEQEKNTPKAIKYYTKLNKLFPDNPIFYRKLAQQYQNAGLLADAFSYYARANKLNPRDMLTLNGLSELFLANQQYAEADSILREGLVIDSMNVNFNLLMAQCQYRLKAYDSTVHYLEKIRYEIDFSPYFNKMLGYSYIQIDSFENSIVYLEKALMDEGSKEYAHYYLATAYEKLENEEYAFHHYEKALEEGISDNVDIYHRNLARIHNDNNALKDAIEHYKDAYKYGKDPLILFFLARASDVYYKDKNIAISYYNRYIKSGHNNPEYIGYSKDRVRYIKEEMHFQN